MVTIFPVKFQEDVNCPQMTGLEETYWP